MRLNKAEKVIIVMLVCQLIVAIAYIANGIK